MLGVGLGFKKYTINHFAPPKMMFVVVFPNQNKNILKQENNSNVDSLPHIA